MQGLLSRYSPLPNTPLERLRHIPGDDGLPLVGHTLRFLADPLAYAQSMVREYGAVSRGSFLFERRINLISADGNAFVLADRDQNFSARLGWEPVLAHLFPRGLMLRDGEDHRVHRRLMQPAFRKEALSAYLGRMQQRIARAIPAWVEQGDLRFFPAVKRLTLEIAADIFLDVTLDAEIEQVGRDFHDLVAASNAINRLPLIGRRFERGLSGRRRLASLIRSRIPQRRNGDGSDLLSQLCRAQDEHSQRYGDDEIVDHLIFLMMAAHDTTTSALTTIAYALARHESWQQRLRELASSLPDKPDAEALSALDSFDWVLRESLRLYPPLTLILRRAVRDCDFAGHSIPAGASVAVYPVATQRDPQFWTDPDAFNPQRFSSARAEHRRHPFAWAPFGGGAHMCLGLHFAELQVKAVLTCLLRAAHLGVAPDYTLPYRLAPIAHPRDGLPLRLDRR